MREVGLFNSLLKHFFSSAVVLKSALIQLPAQALSMQSHQAVAEQVLTLAWLQMTNSMPIGNTSK